MLTRKSFSQRLNLALFRARVQPNFRKIYLAFIFKVDNEVAGAWLSGAAYPRVEQIMEIARRCNTSPEHLLTGANDNMIPMWPRRKFLGDRAFWYG